MKQAEVMALMRRYIDELIEKSDAQNPFWNIEKVRSGQPNKWNYIDGLMMTAILQLYDITKAPRYLAFADAFVRWFVREDGSITTFDPLEYNLDNISPGRNLFTLYDLTRDQRYRKALDCVRGQLTGMPRTRDGNFWHKKIYPHQVWLDGLYMAQPFYMQYEVRYRDMAGCADSFGQFERVHALMRRPNGLYCHGYDESRSMYWADPATGQSAECWLRALGWYLTALVDTLSVSDERYVAERAQLKGYLVELVDAMLAWQHESGMFYQVIDRPDAEGNYLETSGSALFAYAVLKATRLGYLPGDYRPHAARAFFGTASRYLSADESGAMQLGGICLVAGLGGPTHRDGSLNYYFSEPVVSNEAKGVAPMLLAYTELLRQP